MNGGIKWEHTTTQIYLYHLIRQMCNIKQH